MHRRDHHEEMMMGRYRSFEAERHCLALPGQLAVTRVSKEGKEELPVVGAKEDHHTTTTSEPADVACRRSGGMVYVRAHRLLGTAASAGTIASTYLPRAVYRSLAQRAQRELKKDHLQRRRRGVDKV